MQIAMGIKLQDEAGPAVWSVEGRQCSCEINRSRGGGSRGAISREISAARLVAKEFYARRLIRYRRSGVDLGAFRSRQGAVWGGRRRVWANLGWFWGGFGSYGGCRK